MEEGKNVRGLHPEEDGAAETRCDGLAAAHSPSPFVAGGRREGI